MPAKTPSVALVLVAVALHARAGITYELRTEHKGKVAVSTVVADGQSYRVETKVFGEDADFTRQYPIVMSTDGGKTEKYLRPANNTWYAKSTEPVLGSTPPGEDVRWKKPEVTLIEEPESEVIAGLATRKFVLKASCVIESDVDSEILKLHKTRLVLLWVADVACAPAVPLQRIRFGYKELDERVDRNLESVKGLIVRKVDSLTERYEGGRPRTFLTTTEIVDPKCLDVAPAVF